VSVILPIYRQAEQVEPIVARYLESLAGTQRSHELLLVVNSFGDGSLEACQAIAERHPAVRTLQTDRSGWGRAVRLGLTEARGELLCYTNAARTTERDLALLVLYAMTQPGTVVKANRKIRDNWRRRAGSLLYNLQCRALFDLSNWDVNGTPKVFPRSFDRLLNLSRDDDLIDAEFCLICRREGYPMLEVPIFSTRRHGGTSTTNLSSAARMYVGAGRMWLADRQKAA
jgi:glycosyltransferase involved in cell wall biosynthesis